jgi:hypothetical protein
MKTRKLFCLLPVFLLFVGITSVTAQVNEYITCRGLVSDMLNGEPLAFASVQVDGTNISTVTNTEGSFILKIPVALKSGNLVVSFLGYKNKSFPISEFNGEFNRLDMEVSPISLPDVNVVFKDAESLMRAVFDKRGDNYVDKTTEMTAFYRETIKKRKTYVALLESVVDVFKFSYTSARNDIAALYKVRKQTDYEKLDTVVFKLMGGPYNTLFTDVMKDPERVFTDKVFENYIFSYDRSTMIDNRMVYVLDFKQRPTIKEPYFYGKLYIDAQTLALVSAVYDMNLEDKNASSDLFIRRKPLYAKVEVKKARYMVNYIQRDDKWYLGYSRIELNIGVNWKRKLFNTSYESVMEMAVTDWKSASGEKWDKINNRLRTNVVVADAAIGFVDPDFWGSSNVIEPEKPIGSAIKKIQKQLEKKK